MKKYEFTEQEARFLKYALISLQRQVSNELINFGVTKNYPVKNIHYLVLSDQLNACNDLIDKLHNWGI